MTVQISKTYTYTSLFTLVTPNTVVHIPIHRNTFTYLLITSSTVVLRTALAADSLSIMGVYPVMRKWQRGVGINEATRPIRSRGCGVWCLVYFGCMVHGNVLCMVFSAWLR